MPLTVSNQPDASIVIPTFNRKNHVRRAIDASLAQTHPCEVIVCDHGSSDGTPEMMAEHYANRVTYLRRDTDLGPHFCWLEGCMTASGQYLHLQYDDDWIAASYVEQCLKQMRKDVGFVVSHATVVDLKNGNEKPGLPFREEGYKTGVYPIDELERRYIKLGMMISPAALFFRKQDVVDALYPGRLPLQERDYHGVGPDCWVALLAMLRYPKFGYVNEGLAFFGAHEGSITVDAELDKDKSERISKAYAEVRRYYRLLKFAKKWSFLFQAK